MRKKRDPRMIDRRCNYITIKFYFGKDDDIIELIKKEAKHSWDLSNATARIIRKTKG